MTTITLSLIAHTNVGKTTLARTLLRRDVGEVLDQAHVTDVSEAFTLIEAEGHLLRLWDTPGFGDSRRLLARLKREASPIGWLLHQLVDRLRDRPLWCSQEAVRNVRDDADVVLYLVNATERPEGAGYVRLELEILEWIAKPVLVLLNQTGADPEAARAGTAAWSAALERLPSVRGVLSLDAFCRSWVHEGQLFEALAGLLEGQRADAMRVLARAWNARQWALFERTAERMAAFLRAAANDHEPLASALAGRGEKTRAMEALAERLARSERFLWDEVILDHGLEGRAAVELARDMEHVDVEGVEPLSAKKGALLGGVVSGALGGLVADLLAGGLTFGGGLVAGALLGALGGAGLSQGFQLVARPGNPEVRWSSAFRLELARRTALRYLAVAHSGRGRGPFVESEPLARWKEAVTRALARDPVGDGKAEASGVAVHLADALTRVLSEAYPEAARSLRKA